MPGKPQQDEEEEEKEEDEERQRRVPNALEVPVPATCTSDSPSNPTLTLSPLPPPPPSLPINSAVQLILEQWHAQATAALATGGGSGGVSDPFTGAVQALIRLTADFAQRLGLVRTAAATPVNATTVMSQTRDAELELEQKFIGKLAKFVDEWRAHIQKHAPQSTPSARTTPIATASPITPALFFADLEQRAPVVVWLLRHTSVDQRTGLNVIVFTQADLHSSRLPSGAVLDEAARWFASRVLSFPWKRLAIGDDDVDAMMDRLRRLQPRVVGSAVRPHNITFVTHHTNGSPLFPLTFEHGRFVNFVHDPSDYDLMDRLVDVFQEDARLAARRQDAIDSPLGLWYGDASTASRALRGALDHAGRIDPHTLREAIFHTVKECTQFKPSLVVAVIRFFHARRVLDFSAGWGDRLVGAIAADVERYQAFDPNVALREGHAAIVRRFVPTGRRADYDVQYTGALVYSIPG